MGTEQGKSRRVQTQTKGLSFMTEEKQNKKTLRAQQELSDIFSNLGYKPFSTLSADEKKIISYKNPYHRVLYSFRPHMKGKRSIRIESEVGLNYDTGDIFVTASVSKHPAAFTPRGEMYIVKNCGKKLDNALQTAQTLYDETFAYFKTTKTGKKAEYTPSPEGDRYTCDYTPQVFSKKKEYIAVRLAHEIQEMEKQRAKQREEAERDNEERDHARELGYV